MSTIFKKWFQLIGFLVILSLFLFMFFVLRESFLANGVSYLTILQQIDHRYNLKKTLKSLSHTKWHLLFSTHSLAYDHRSALVDHEGMKNLLSNDQDVVTLENLKFMREKQGKPIFLKSFLEFKSDMHLDFITDIIDVKNDDFESRLISHFTYTEDEEIPGMIHFSDLKGQNTGFFQIISADMIVTRMKYGDMIFIRDNYDSSCVDRKEILGKKFIKYYEIAPYYHYQEKKDFESYSTTFSHKYYQNFVTGLRYYLRPDGYLEGIPGLTGFAHSLHSEKQKFQVLQSLLDQDIHYSFSGSLDKTKSFSSENFLHNDEDIGLQKLECYNFQRLNLPKEWNLPSNILIMYKIGNLSEDRSHPLFHEKLANHNMRKFYLIYPNSIVIECFITYEGSSMQIGARELYIAL